jgi:hypothetical protein
MFEYKKRTFGTKPECMHNCGGGSLRKRLADEIFAVQLLRIIRNDVMVRRLSAPSQYRAANR